MDKATLEKHAVANGVCTEAEAKTLDWQALWQKLTPYLLLILEALLTKPAPGVKAKAVKAGCCDHAACCQKVVCKCYQALEEAIAHKLACCEEEAC